VAEVELAQEALEQEAVMAAHQSNILILKKQAVD
jgi:hypothetical protein